MKHAIRLLGPAFLVSVLAVGCATTISRGPMPGGTAITITQSFSFDPERLSVDRGMTVTWTNLDTREHTTTHTVTSGTPGDPSGTFDQRIEGGKTFTFTFADAGTFEYFCSIHQSMRGTVVVK
jgi:plastocyanin